MMRTIYKYELQPGVNHLKLPDGARVLDVQQQRDKACLWALIDPKCKETMRTFVIVGTGHPLDESIDRAVHVATFQQPDQGLVWHVFEPMTVPE
jgi:predicted mannosyl-3-phosphoglycerate phosphatase (HAD superfamily)